MHEECGVFGIFNKEDTSIDVAKLTYFALYALQHRGQESAGIAVSDGEKLLIYKDLGLVSEVFNEEKLKTLQGNCAIGHVRYSTTGANIWENSQPLLKNYKGGTFSLAHNGNLVNQAELKTKLRERDIQNSSSTDSEIICNLIKTTPEESIEKNIEIVAAQLKGAFSLVVMTEDKLIGVKDSFGFHPKLIGVKDSFGFHPLALGKLGDSYVFASETCAFNLIGAEFVREVEPGEMVVIDKEGVRSTRILPNNRKALCIFEFVYFARPDSNICGENVALSRQKMGRRLAREYPVQADIVVPVPDSGISAAIGYAAQSGIPYEEGLIKNRYIGRTFIQPEQLIRDFGVKIKLSPIKEIIKGKRVILIDDSIVRGTTSRKIVKLVREAGACEVHVRISSPPIFFPCFYGIDTPKREYLWASNHTIEETKKWIEADSLGYLSIEGLCSVFNKIPADDFCLACFNGKYPT
jgi:amidophosphoribosyltransferase